MQFTIVVHSDNSFKKCKPLFKRLYLFIFRDWEREGEKHQCVVASHTAPTEDLAHNPDQESNQPPFCSQAST